MDAAAAASASTQPTARPPAQVEPRTLYVRCSGETLSHQQFVAFTGPILAAFMSHLPQDRKTLHEALWMAQLYMPEHVAVKERKISVPLHTQPEALRLIGWKEEDIGRWSEARRRFIEQQRQRQQLQVQQQQQQQQQQTPRAKSQTLAQDTAASPDAPSVQAAPPTPKSVKLSGSQPPTIQPTMSTAEVGAGQQRGNSEMLDSPRARASTPSQRSSTTAPSPGSTRARMSPAIPQSSSSQGTTMARVPHVLSQDSGTGVSSQVSMAPPQHMPHHGPPVNATLQARNTRPHGKSMPPGVTNNSGTLARPEGQDQSDQSDQPAPTPTLGLFRPPLSRSNSGQGDAPRSRPPLTEEQKAAFVDKYIEAYLPKLQKAAPEQYVQVRAWLGDNPDFDKKKKIFHQFQEWERQLAARKQHLTVQRDQAPDVTSKKRKTHPVAAEQTHPKRQIIDLTVPLRKQIFQRALRAPALDNTPSGGQTNLIPSPNLAEPDALRTHACIYGVSMHDVELKSNTYDTLTSRTYNHTCTSNASFFQRVLGPTPTSRSDRDTRACSPDQSVADALATVRSSTYNWKWSEGRQEDLEDVDEDTLISIGCYRDGDKWRAPEPDKWNEERAIVDWELTGMRKVP